MSGKTVLITGATTDLGLATALLLAFPEHAAMTPLYVASSPDLDGVSGGFFLQCRTDAHQTYHVRLRCRSQALEYE